MRNNTIWNIRVGCCVPNTHFEMEFTIDILKTCGFLFSNLYFGNFIFYNMCAQGKVADI